MVLTVILYEKTATTFTDNGLCVLSPSSCVVREVACGEYELELEHPMDATGKHLMLTEERLIKAPVPKMVIPQVTLPELKVWKVVSPTALMSKTPTARYTKSLDSQVKAVRNNPNNYEWSEIKYYNSGAIVQKNGDIYKARTSSMDVSPSVGDLKWEKVGTVSNPQGDYDTGSVIENLAVDDIVYKIADAGGTYIKARSVSGKVGFVAIASCEETVQQVSETLPEQTITEQVFRIYETSCDEETHLFAVKARHISYDLANNCLYDCKVTEAEPNECISSIQASMMEYDQRKIACNITGKKVSKDWSFKNPISALLDPDDGLVNVLHAKIIRNNNDLFILDIANRAGITIEYGVNMLGVNWTRSIENVVTRIVPRSGSSDKGYKYIENGGRILNGNVQNQGKTYVESEHADLYNKPRIRVMNCSYQVDQQYEKPDGTKAKYTEAEVKEKMLKDAKEQFTVKGVDGVDITLDVEFLLLGDTEEYKQYRGLQTVCLYDVIKVRTGKSGIEATAQVTEYDYDCLRERYNSIKLGTINSFNRRIPSYRLVNQSITYEKLSPDLINRIITSNDSSSTDSGDAGSSTGGGGVSVTSLVADNTVSYDGIVKKGSGQLNKAWQTDNQGNPAWRDATTSGLYNIGTVDSTGTLSSIQAAVTAFGNARKNNNNTTGQFNISYSNPPSDLPSQAMEWEYAEGYITARYIDTNGMIGTGDVVLLSYNTGKIAKASIYNGVLMSWSVINSGTFIPASQKGAASGVAELDSAGKVPAAQLPSYVDDVLEYANKSAFPATGQTGKIYVAIDTGKTYRWSGSEYIELSTTTVTDSDPTLAWGTRSKVGSVQGTDLHVTLPGGTATQSAKGLMSSDDKTKLDEMSGFFNLGTVDTATSLSSLAKAVEKLGNLHKSNNNVVGVVNWSYSNIPADLPDTTDQNWVYGNGMIIARYIGSGGTVDNGEFVIFGYGGKIAKSAIYNNSIVSWTIHDPDLKLDKSQGSANAGKNLYVGSNGNIALGDMIELGTISDLFVSNLVAGTTYHFSYGNSTTNAPNTDGGQGYIFTHPSSASWGCVIAYTPTMQWLCPIQNGEYKTWKKTITTVSNSLSDTSTTNALSAAKGKEVYDLANGLLKASGSAVLYNVDANDYKDPGTYFFATGCTNVPGTYFICTVITHPNDFYIQIGSRAGKPKLLYKRSWQNGSWGAWQPMRGIFEDTYSGTTNGYGFAISNVASTRKILSAYSDQGPVFYWVDSNVWVFGLINITQDTTMNRKPNQAMTVYYKYYDE